MANPVEIQEVTQEDNPEAKSTREKLFDLAGQMRFMAGKAEKAERLYEKMDTPQDTVGAARHGGRADGLRMATSMLLEVLMEERRG